MSIVDPSLSGWHNKLLFETNARITSFGQDKAGEIYLLSDTGEVYKLIRK